MFLCSYGKRKWESTSKGHYCLSRCPLGKWQDHAPTETIEQMPSGGLQSHDKETHQFGSERKEKPLAGAEKGLLTFNKVVPQSSPKNLGWTLAVSLEKIMPQVY